MVRSPAAGLFRCDPDPGAADGPLGDRGWGVSDRQGRRAGEEVARCEGRLRISPIPSEARLRERDRGLEAFAVPEARCGGREARVGPDDEVPGEAPGIIADNTIEYQDAVYCARAKVPGVASQVPVLTAPSGEANASLLASRGEGLLPTDEVWHPPRIALPADAPAPRCERFPCGYLG